MNEVKELILVIVVILLVPGSIIAFLAGAIDQTSLFSSCTYSSIASYHPFYIAGCELFKKRFKNEN